MHIKWPKVKTFIEIFKESDLDLDEILNLKNMENNYGTPFALMMQSESISDAYDNLIYYMKINNLIINYENEINDFKDIKSRLVFEEKENMRTEIKPNGEVHLHIHSFLKEVKEVHIPPVDSETDIKSQVIDIITKALQEAKIKTDGTK